MSSKAARRATQPVAEPVLRQALLFPVTSLSVCCLLILRRPDAILNPQFWAEDGVVFFHDQLDIGFVQALFNPYAGYLHVIPRLIAGFASVFPVAAHPLIYNAWTLAIAALSLSLFSAPAFRSWLRSDVLRVCVSLAAACVVYADDLIGTVTNLQWFLVIPALLLFFKPADPNRPEPAWRQVSVAVLGLLISLSCPLLMILLPLVVWRLYKGTGWDRSLPLALALGASIQLILVLQSDFGPHPMERLGILALLESSGVAILYRVVLSTVFGHVSAKSVADGRLAGVLLGVTAAATFWIAALVARADKASRQRILVSLYLLSTSVLAALAGRDMAKDYAAPFPDPGWRTARYFFLGSCIFIYLVAFTLQMLTQSQLLRAALLVLVFSGGAAENFRALPFNDLHWAQYAPAIDRWLTDRREHKPRQELAVPVNPSPAFPSWSIRLPGSSDGPGANYEGRLVRRPGGSPEDLKVYLVVQGKKHWITDDAWIKQNALRFPAGVELISAADLESIPTDPTPIR